LADARYSAADIERLEKDVEFYNEIRSAMKKHSGEELDIKPFEADMRHLINTYIHADPAAELGNLSSLSLTELIIETGIHDAIAKNLNAKGKLSRNSIAEGIINNVRKTIIRDQLTDPRFYEEISKLLDDLIKQKREETISYEEFLKRMEALAKKLAKGYTSSDIPDALQGNQSAIAVYNNLPDILASEPNTNEIQQTSAAYGDKRLQLTLKIDRVMREEAPAAWKGDPARESQVLNALYPVMEKSKAATKALFDLIKNIPGY
jgi:type I restriction enzyme R subunit